MGDLIYSWRRQDWVPKQPRQESLEDETRRDQRDLKSPVERDKGDGSGASASVEGAEERSNWEHRPDMNELLGIGILRNSPYKITSLKCRWMRCKIRASTSIMYNLNKV